MNSPVNIAYLINTYPRASHSFIRREIQAVERQGLTVHRFAMRSDRAALKDAGDLAEDDRTEHVLAQPKLALLRSALNVQPRLYAYAGDDLLPAGVLEAAGLQPIGAYTRMSGPLPAALPDVPDGYRIVPLSDRKSVV